MKHSARLAALIASVMALSVVAVAVAQQHQPSVTQTAVMKPPSKDDTHVHKLYDIMKAAFAPGATFDHATLMAQVKALSAEHAAETGQDAAAMEAHIFAMLQAAAPVIQANPEKVATFDAFWETLHEAGGAAGHH